MVRKSILFIAEGVTLAHVARPLALARNLDASCYDVSFACLPCYRHLCEQAAIPWFAVASISSEQFLQRLATGKPLYDLDTLRRYVQEDFKLIEKIKPDLIVGDFRLSLSVSARKLGIPYITITSAYWSPYAKPNYTIPSHPLIKWVGLRLANLLFRLTRPAVFAFHSLPLNRVRREYGLPSLGPDLRKVYTDADVTLYADVPEMIPTYHLPDHHHYIGPVLWSPQVDQPDWWGQLGRERPLIYVTLGSSGESNLLPQILTALQGMDVTVVATTAGRIAIQDVPDNAYVTDYLSGEAITKLASLVICNGGSPTTHQAFAEGVPVLAIPSNLDQYLNMAYTVQAGAGRIIRSEQMSVACLKESVSGMLADAGYSANAARLMGYLRALKADKILASLLAAKFQGNHFSWK